MSLIRKKGFSAKGSRRIARRMDDAVVGTHVARRNRTRAVSDPSSMGRADFRMRSRAERGVVDVVRPETHSGESSAAHRKRMGRSGYGEEIRTKSRRRRVGLIALIVIIVLAIGIGVGYFVFMSSTSGKMAVHDDTVKETLTAATPGEPYYALLVADLDSLNGSTDAIEAVMLARIDEQNKRIGLLSIPANLQVRLSDGSLHALHEAKSVGQRGELITAVNEATGIKISHYLETDADGIAKLVERLDGLTMTLAQEVDDPQAGSVYLPAGEQDLDANAVLTLLRAKNFSESIVTQADNRCEVVSAIVLKAANGEVGAASIVDAIADSIGTDLSSGDLINLLGLMKDAGAGSIVYGHVPGYELARGSAMYYQAYEDSLAEVMALLDTGRVPVIHDGGQKEYVDKESFTIEVRNGSGVDGGAGMIADILRGAGYRVEKTGNADAYVYNETLVIYRDPNLLAAANEVLDTLGTGRVVDAGAFYVFDDDLLVVLGSDWKAVRE